MSTVVSAQRLCRTVQELSLQATATDIVQPDGGHAASSEVRVAVGSRCRAARVNKDDPSLTHTSSNSKLRKRLFVREREREREIGGGRASEWKCKAYRKSIALIYFYIHCCWAPHLEMSPKRFAMATTALLSASDKTQCALVICDSEWGTVALKVLFWIFTDVVRALITC